MDSFKKNAVRHRNCIIGQRKLFIRQNHLHEKKKIPVDDLMTHVVKIDILAGPEEKGNLHFILKIIFHCIFIEKLCIFIKPVR